MTYPYYTGKRETPIEKPQNHLPKPISHKLIEPKDYISTREMVNAVNVALIMNQPLLLTGEPGSGKTQLAHRVAWELGLGDPLSFETKSTSTARDLFYVFNTLARFHAAEIRESLDETAFITYQALGKAILLANHPGDDKIKKVLPEDFVHNGPKRSVVLIDEIDKAPRDFPNDILNEIEQMFFKIPELNNPEIKAPENMQPIAI
ncbi:ATPase AAA, partial [Candidatus Magnetomorum sp. HK-1]